jgi:hypothetical protein
MADAKLRLLRIKDVNKRQAQLDAICDSLVAKLGACQ